ncbi:MAG TPA: helix-turn-helix domain-containing protein [Acidimicrobiales bacterium]|nr:helix-turn-helix domain-containing protein [Acidimicrobiales bacterium]
MTPTLQQQARALGDPTRHAIFRYLADAGEPVDVARLTAQFSLHHNAIRQHVSKLVDTGLVEATTVSAGGRGRPKLVFAVAPRAYDRWGTLGPYERLSLLLAEVISSGDTPVEVGRRAGREAAPSEGPRDTVADIVKVMARQGFDPEVRSRRGGVEIVLRVCPFESTALADPRTVCGLHQGIAEGLAEGTGVTVEGLVANDPRRANCRLRLGVGEAG